jgi:hypothetical protein
MMNNDDFDFTNPDQLRVKAEEILMEKQMTSETLLETDVRKLLHELQVHQIELEMQNDELHLAYETAGIALKKYTMLFDLSPMGYLTLESDCTICELNFTAAEMLGERRFSMAGRNFILFISEESKLVFNSFIRRVFNNHTKESCNVIMGKDYGHSIPVYMEGVITGDDDRCLLSVVDVSGF